MVLNRPVSKSLKSRGFFYGEMAKFARAGFGIDKAAESILHQTGSDAVARGICRAILSGLSAGKSVADSLRTSAFPISDLEVAMIEAAEKGGQLDVGFRHLADYFRQEDQARRSVRRALVYPVFLLHFALAVGIGITALLRQVNPNASGSEGRETLVQGFVWVAVGYGLFLTAAFLWRWASRLAESRAGIDVWLQRLPLIGPVRRHRGLSRFSEVLHISLLSAQRMDESWRQAGEASQSGRLRAFTAATSRRLAAGESIGSVVAASKGALPSDFQRGLTTAEQAGSLDEETAQWADYFREASAESLERLAEWLPKFVYWIVLLFAAAMVIRVALSYRDLLEGVLNFSY